MQRFKARDVTRIVHEHLAHDPQWWHLNWADMPKWHEIVFHDGTIVKSHIKQSFYSALFWRIFELHPGVAIYARHHVSQVIKEGEALDTKTHLKLTSRIYEDIVEQANLLLPQQKEPVLREIYQAISDACGVLSKVSARHQLTVDYLDFLQIAKLPEIEAIKQWAYENPARIKAAYGKARQVIRHNTSLATNGLTLTVRAGMMKPNQVDQCVVFRGYGTEVDGATYRKMPIWSNYVLGNTGLFQFVADSRTAAKSHYYSDSSLKNAEYMSRKFRLFTNPVEQIDWNDCGNDEFIPWVVKAETKDAEGATLYQGDLPNLIGKYYRTEKGGEVKWLRGDEKHLIGKMIYLRSVITCKAPNPHRRCHMCIGKLSVNISRFANMGHLGGITTCKPISQSILSIKHVNTSATALRVKLDELGRKYFHTGKLGTAFYLNEGLKDLSMTMTVAKSDALGLTDVKIVEDVTSISLTRISSVPQVRISTIIQGRDVSVFPKLTQKQRNAHFSYDFLEYLRVHGWTIDEQGNFVFDFDGWDFEKPVFVMPSMEASFSDLSNQVDKLVRANQSKRKERRHIDAPVLLLNQLFDLVNSMLSVNILSHELIVYALMVKGEKSYGLAGGSPDAILGIAEPLTKYRSLASAMLFQSQSVTLTNPVNFLEGDRPDSPFDVLFAPHEVVQEYRQRGYG